jgi:hypothetical protein
MLGEASKQQLETVFGTSKDVDAMLILLEKGHETTGKGFGSGSVGTNAARGSQSVDTRSKGNTGI